MLFLMLSLEESQYYTGLAFSICNQNKELARGGSITI